MYYCNTDTQYGVKKMKSLDLDQIIKKNISFALTQYWNTKKIRYLCNIRA